MTFERIFLIACQIVVFGLLIFSIIRLNEIKHLVSNDSISTYKVLKTHCSGSGASSMLEIEYEKGKYYVRYPRKRCRELSEGDYVELYYSKESDFFYVPGNRSHQRYIYGLSALLILLLIPWSKISKKIKKLKYVKRLRKSIRKKHKN
jgi:hypothetical protein